MNPEEVRTALIEQMALCSWADAHEDLPDPRDKAKTDRRTAILWQSYLDDAALMLDAVLANPAALLVLLADTETELNDRRSPEGRRSMSRCCICRRWVKPWSRIIVWHGDASGGASVPVHKDCGLAATDEFLRGLRLCGDEVQPTMIRPEEPDVAHYTLPSSARVFAVAALPKDGE